MKMRKILIPILVIALVASLVLSFVGCQTPAANKNGNGGDIEVAALTVKNQTLLSASTSGLLLAKMQPASGPSNAPDPKPEVEEEDATTETPEADATADAAAIEAEAAQVEVIEPYMDLVESYLQGGMDVNSETPDKEGFDTKYVIKFKDADGNEVEIVIYINMVLLVDGVEDTTTEVDLDDFDEEESEQEFSVDGIIIIGDKEYSVIGTYEVSSETEVEEDGTTETEHEKELKLKAVDPDNEDNYIEITVKEETETEAGQTEREKEFTYLIKEKDKDDVVLKMKMEREQNQEKLELCVKDGSKKEVKFKFKKQEHNGKTKYKGEIDNGVDADKVEFEVSIDAEGYKYTLRDQNGEQKGEQRQMRRGGYEDGKVCTADAEVNKPEGDTADDPTGGGSTEPGTGGGA